MKIPIFNIKKTTGRYLSTELFSAGRQVFKHVNFDDVYLAVVPDKSCWQVLKHDSFSGRIKTLLQGPKYLPDMCASKCYISSSDKKWTFWDAWDGKHTGEHFLISCETHSETN